MMMANIYPIDRIESVYLEIKSIKDKYEIGDLENLRGKIITGIELKKVSEVAVSPAGLTVISDTAFKNSFLTLAVEGGEEIIADAPLSIFDAAQNDGKVKHINHKVINWPKSFITVGNTALIALNEVFVVVIYYSNQKEDLRRRKENKGLGFNVATGCQ